MNTQEKILDLWALIDRPGIHNLIDFLKESDFFEAPCSTKYHLAKPGGLAEHSLNVFLLLEEKVDRYGLDISESSVIICGLGHDLCKTNFYKENEEPCTDKQYSYLLSLWPSDVSMPTNVTKEYASQLIDWRKNRPNEPMPEQSVSYAVDDRFPMGHGEKSVSVLQDFITLTPEEKLAIRWHMTAFDASIHFDYPNGFAFRKAAEITPLVTLLFTADYEASQILER